jgi:hypothetical protein
MVVIIKKERGKFIGIRIGARGSETIDHAL